jgi:hypothetical protein
LAQVSPYFVDALWFEFPDLFASVPLASDQSRFMQSMEVLCDTLSRDIRTFRDFGNRQRAAHAQFLDDLQSRLIAKGGKYRRDAHGFG